MKHFFKIFLVLMLLLLFSSTRAASGQPGGTLFEKTVPPGPPCKSFLIIIF